MDLLKLIRPFQWSKSLLIFVPLLLTPPGSIVNLQVAVLSFAGFATASSVGYVINDILDAKVDRLNPKRNIGLLHPEP